jgi:hypothetical protein
MSCNCKTIFKKPWNIEKEEYFVQFGFSLSNWQKVQLNTDLFLDTQRYLYRKELFDKYLIKKEQEFLIKWEAGLSCWCS